jgi:hypothetical protein
VGPSVPFLVPCIDARVRPSTHTHTLHADDNSALGVIMVILTVGAVLAPIVFLRGRQLLEGFDRLRRTACCRRRCGCLAAATGEGEDLDGGAEEASSEPGTLSVVTAWLRRRRVFCCKEAGPRKEPPDGAPSSVELAPAAPAASLEAPRRGASGAVYIERGLGAMSATVALHSSTSRANVTPAARGGAGSARDLASLPSASAGRGEVLEVKPREYAPQGGEGAQDSDGQVLVHVSALRRKG